MKKNFFKIFYVSILCVLTATIGFAQDERTISSAAGDLYVISAKAGGINLVEGSVSVQRSTGDSGYLVKGDSLEAGDKVSTAADSRVEVLMNPGSFVRMNQNSEFEFTTTNLDDLNLQVNRGSAIFEVFASNDFNVTVTTPKAKFYLIKTGVYRVNVLENGIGKLEVYNGKAQIGNLKADTIEKGQSATVDGDQIAIADFDRKNLDDFEDWSKSRAKLISKANKKLATKRLTNSLLATNNINCYDSLGLWVFNGRYNSYSFLPFGAGWRSPYGFGLGTSTGICHNSYNDYFYRRQRQRYPRGGGNGGGTTSTNTTPAANIARGNRNVAPPFRRIENSGNANTRSSSRRSIFPQFPSGGSRRTPGSTTPTTTTTAPRSTSPSSKPQSRPPLSSPKGKDN